MSCYMTSYIVNVYFNFSLLGLCSIVAMNFTSLFFIKSTINYYYLSLKKFEIEKNVSTHIITISCVPHSFFIDTGFYLVSFYFSFNISLE